GSNAAYLPPLNFTGSDTFTYAITDGHGGNATGLVTVTVWVPPAINSLRRQTNGNPLMRFQGIPGLLHQIQASRNLVDWADIGPASETSPGQFQFEDTDGAIWPARFYRIRAP